MKSTNELTIAVAGTGYVGLSVATLLAQHHKVYAVDIIPEKVELINRKQSPIQDDYIEKYLAEKNVEEAFKSAHTLKGVAGNLGLDPIAKCASEMVELLRGKDQLEEIDADQLSSVSEELQSVHRSLLNILAEL